MAWWDYPSNFSNGQSVNGIGSFLQYANYATNSKLGYLIIVAIFAVSFLSMKVFSSTKAFASASFITTFLSVFLLRIGLISPVVTIILAALTVIGILVVRDEADKGL